MVLRAGGRIPVVAEAGSVLSLWGPQSQARCPYHVPALDVPILVLVGGREDAPYQREAEDTAAAARDARLVVLDGEDHYFRRDRALMADTVYDWIQERGLST